MSDFEDENNKEREGSRFSFGEHLEELRARVIIAIIATIFCFGFCWLFKSTILLLATRPHMLAMSKFGLTSDLQVISYQEGFYAYIKLCFISGIFFAYPFIVYQLWKFVSPGLYTKEKRYGFLFISLSYLAFIVGVLFGYFFLIPIGLQFLISILGTGVAPIITMGQYISLVFLLTIALGLVFQLPLVILLITKLGLIKAEQFISWRKYAVLATFIIAAIITPPDPFTQIMTAIPMIALYELGILLSKPTKKRIFYFGSMVGGGTLAIVLFFMIFTSYTSSASISKFAGNVKLIATERNGSNEINLNNDLNKNGTIKKGMSVKTGPDSKASFNMKCGTIVSLDKDTEVKIIDKKTINIAKGQIFLNIDKVKTDFIAITPNGSAVTSSGEINIEVLPFETIVTVVKGKTVLTNGDTKETVKEGRQGRIVTGGKVVNVGDIIEWSR